MTLELNVGLQVGALTLIENLNPELRGNRLRRYWRVRCKCGNEKSIVADDLKAGYTKSCGCVEYWGGKSRIERFYEKTVWSDETCVISGVASRCLLWVGSRCQVGYGKLTIARKSFLAHRWIYERYFGAVAGDMVLDHLCHGVSECRLDSACPHRPCVNPFHLEPVTSAENIRRGHSPGMIARRGGKCGRGHIRTEHNTYVCPDGSIRCRDCRKLRGN